MAALRILELFRPRRVAARLADLDPVALSAEGIRGLVVDVDNTLVPYGSAAPTEEARRWVAAARDAGLRLVLVTNNRTRRTRAVADGLGLPVASGLMKPSTSGLRRALAMMRTAPEETALVGDQLLTDILAGNRLGLFTILVQPMGRHEFPTTRLINRTIERVLVRLLHLPTPPA
ncbi:MAG: YqeG family HAD IIIA-type phosphatase [Candidatus Rokuibacteriota bacterium]